MATRDEARAARDELKRLHPGCTTGLNGFDDSWAVVAYHDDPESLPASVSGVTVNRLPREEIHARPRPPEEEWDSPAPRRPGDPRRGSHAGDPRHAAVVAEAIVESHDGPRTAEFYDSLVDAVRRADSLVVFEGSDGRLHAVGTGAVVEQPTAVTEPPVWTAAALREHIGEVVTTARPRTPLEVKVYGEGEEGGSGVLVGVVERPLSLADGGEREDYGVVPWVELDWGMSWAILPGSTVEFTPAEGEHR